MRPPEQLKPEEQTALQQILEEDADLATGYRLAQRYALSISAGVKMPSHNLRENPFRPILTIMARLDEGQ